MPSKHSRTGPSSAERWVHCPPSLRLGEEYGAPDTGSVYAAEGTEAHALCEYLLKSWLKRPCEDPRPTMQYYSPEMEEAAQGYLQYIREKREAYMKAATHNNVICAADVPEIFVEQSVDLREYR